MIIWGRPFFFLELLRNSVNGNEESYSPGWVDAAPLLQYRRVWHRARHGIPRCGPCLRRPYCVGKESIHKHRHKIKIKASMFSFSGRNEKPGVKVEETSLITAPFKSASFYVCRKTFTVLWLSEYFWSRDKAKNLLSVLTFFLKKKTYKLTSSALLHNRWATEGPRISISYPWSQKSFPPKPHQETKAPWLTLDLVVKIPV